MTNLEYDEINQMVKSKLALLVYEKNLSFRKISRDLGHSESYMQKLLSKKYALSLKAIVELCNYLNIHLVELFSIEQKIDINIADFENLLEDQSPESLSKYYKTLKCLVDKDVNAI